MWWIISNYDAPDTSCILEAVHQKRLQKAGGSAPAYVTSIQAWSSNDFLASGCNMKNRKNQNIRIIYFPSNNTIRSLQKIHSVVLNELCVLDITALVSATCKSGVTGLGWVGVAGVLEWGWNCLYFFFPKKPLHLSLLNSMRLLSTHVSCLLRTFWMSLWCISHSSQFCVVVFIVICHTDH